MNSLDREYFIDWCQFWIPIKTTEEIDKHKFSSYIESSLKEWSIDQDYNIAINSEIYYKLSTGYIIPTSKLMFEDEEERKKAMHKNINIMINDLGIKIYLYGSFFRSNEYRKNFEQIFKFMEDFKKIYVNYTFQDVNDEQISLSRLDIACNDTRNFQEYQWEYIHRYKRQNIFNQIQAPTMYNYYNELGEKQITGISIGRRGSEFAYFRAYDKRFDPNNEHDLKRFKTVDFVRIEHELGHRKLKSLNVYDDKFKYNLGNYNVLKIIYDYPTYITDKGKSINQFENIISRLEYSKNIIFLMEKEKTSERIKNDFPEFNVRRWDPVKQIVGCLRRCNEQEKRTILKQLKTVKFEQ